MFTPSKINRLKFSLTVLIFAMLSSPCGMANEAILAIDAGHSKLHSGVVSASGKPEFEFNAALAGFISDFLLQQGVYAVRIGHEGDMERLTQRTELALEANAQFFLSIHHDSVQPQFFKTEEENGITRHYSDYASGFSLFVSRKNPALETSLQCASAIGSALKKQGLHPSEHHAEKIAGESKEWADQENGVYYYDNLIVLKTAAMPAVLLEAGVIVNPDEEQRVQTPEMRNTIAQAVATGLANCGVMPANLLPSRADTLSSEQK